jgi:hypothetical protein
MAAGGRQRADQVDVDVGEAAVRNRLSLLVVGGLVCEPCRAGKTSKPWPLVLWPWPSVASRNEVVYGV